MYILHTVLYTSLTKMLTRRICLTIRSFFSWWLFPLLLWPSLGETKCSSFLRVKRFIQTYVLHTWNTFKIFSVIWPVTLELKKTPCENQRTPSFMSVWVIPLERMTFQKYSWCSKILQFDVRLIFREHSYSLHHKNKHWNFILLIFHQRGKLWVNYTNMRKKKKKPKQKF